MASIVSPVSFVLSAGGRLSLAGTPGLHPGRTGSRRSPMPPSWACLSAWVPYSPRKPARNPRGTAGLAIIADSLWRLAYRGARLCPYPASPIWFLATNARRSQGVAAPITSSHRKKKPEIRWQAPEVGGSAPRRCPGGAGENENRALARQGGGGRSQPVRRLMRRAGRWDGAFRWG